MVADVAELEILDASEMHPRRLNAKEVLTPNRVFFLIFPIPDGTAKLFGRDHAVRRSTLREEQPVRSEDLREELQGNSERSQPTEQKMTLKPAMTLVNGRGLHLSSSRRTSSSAVRAQRRIILNPTEVHWRDQDNARKSGCVTRKTY